MSDELNKEKMLEIFSRFDEKLRNEGNNLDIYVVGGSAISLMYDSRRTTMDIDAFYTANSGISKNILEFSDEHGLPEDWLNNHVMRFGFEDDRENNPQGTNIFEGTNLKVTVASPEFLLFMKCLSWRDSDNDLMDAVTLAKETGLTTYDELYENAYKFRTDMHPGINEIMLSDIVLFLETGTTW